MHRYILDGDVALSGTEVSLVDCICLVGSDISSNLLDLSAFMSRLFACLVCVSVYDIIYDVSGSSIVLVIGACSDLSNLVNKIHSVIIDFR